MHNPPCLCENTEMVYVSSRDSTNYRSHYIMICMSLLHGLCPHYSLDSWRMSYIAVLDAMVKRKIYVTCRKTDPDYPLSIFFFLQYFNSASFSQCFASFHFISNSFPSTHLSSTLGGGSFLFMSKTFLVIMFRVILKTHTLIYLQLW